MTTSSLPQQAGPVTFPNGARMAFEPDPDVTRCTPPTSIVEQTYASINAGLAKIEEIKADALLSPVGKAARIEEAGDAVLADVLKGQRAFAKLHDDIVSANAKAYVPPPLEATDAVGFLADQERRAYMRGLDAKDLTQLLTAWQRGEQLDLAVALARSPIPAKGSKETEITGFARDAWAVKVRRDDPRLAAQVDAFDRSHAWGVRVFGHLSGIAQSAFKPDSARMKRIAEKVT